MEKTLSTSYLLHAQPYKETSLLVRLFSQEFGRFSVIAKGVKRKQSQALRAILQPFILLNVEFAGRNELKTLCKAESINQHPPYSQQEQRLPSRALACGYYLNELLIRSTEEGQEFPELFNCYKNSLNALHQPTNFTFILRNFEVCLLRALGISPSWECDVMGEAINEASYYQYVPESGFSQIEEQPPEHQFSSNSNFFSGTAIVALGKGEYAKTNVKECQQLTQRLLRKIIGSKPLESRKLWI